MTLLNVRSSFYFSAERDWYLYFVSDKTWTNFALDNLEDPGEDWTLRIGCDNIFFLLLNAVFGDEVTKEDLLAAGGMY